MCPTGYAQNLGHQWAGFLIDDFAWEVVSGCTTRNWNQLLRKAVPPSEIEVGDAQNSCGPIFSKFQKEGKGVFRTPQRASSFTADSVLHRDHLNHYQCFSLIPTFKQGLPASALPFLLSASVSMFWNFFVYHLLSFKAANPLITFLSHLGTWGTKLPSQIFHKFLQKCLWNDPLTLPTLLVRHLSVLFLHVCSAPR